MLSKAYDLALYAYLYLQTLVLMIPDFLDERSQSWQRP